MGNKTSTTANNSDPVTTSAIEGIGLQRMTIRDTTEPSATAGESFPAGKLWKDQPVIIFVIRRPGCPLCREHALELSEKQPDFAARGAKLVGVVHEKLGVEEFSGFFKNGEIYFDEQKSFFNALGMRWEGLSGALKPSAISNVKRAKAKGVNGNFKGEGRLLGGLLVVGAGDSGVAFEHRESMGVVGVGVNGATGRGTSKEYWRQVFGDHSKLEDIMAAVDKVTTASS